VSGKGQWVQTSLLQAQIFMLDFQAARWLMEGRGAEAGRQQPPDLDPDRRVQDQPTATSTSPSHGRRSGSASAALGAGAIGIMTFNNPERHNAVSLEMWEAADRILGDFVADPAIRVIV
jgi:hypothetical protein